MLLIKISLMTMLSHQMPRSNKLLQTEWVNYENLYKLPSHSGESLHTYTPAIDQQYEFTDYFNDKDNECEVEEEENTMYQCTKSSECQGARTCKYFAQKC